jgi:hypothetical protein
VLFAPAFRHQREVEVRGANPFEKFDRLSAAPQIPGARGEQESSHGRRALRWHVRCTVQEVPYA